jgi:hypothetical protein
VPAQAAFDAAAGCVAVRVGAIGSAGGMTFAAVWPIHELHDGEQIFIAAGVKIDAPYDDRPVMVIRSRLQWWWLERAYTRWRRRRDASFGIAAPS